VRFEGLRSPAGTLGPPLTLHLRDAQKPDLQGSRIPAGATDGSVVWIRLNKVPVMGRLVVLQRHRGMASNYDCGIGCECPANFTAVSVAPAAWAMLVNDLKPFLSNEVDTDCNSAKFYYDVTTGAGWLSNLVSVATVDNLLHKGQVKGQGGGSAGISADWTGIRYTLNHITDECDEIVVGKRGNGTDIVVTITGPQTVWWFNSQTPSGYATTITLTAMPSGATSYTWSLTTGTDKATLSGQSGNTINLTGHDLSTSSGDVTARVSVTTSAGTKIATRTVTVRGPKTLVAGATPDSCDSGYGYLSLLNYTIKDNLGALMPSSIPLNESWTSPVTNEPAYPNANWRRQEPPGSFTSTDSTFADRIQGEAFSLPATPTPTCPPPLGSTAVQHWGQEFRVGTLTPGSGARVQTDNIQKYLDHARHTNVHSPAP